LHSVLGSQNVFALQHVKSLLLVTLGLSWYLAELCEDLSMLSAVLLSLTANLNYLKKNKIQLKVGKCCKKFGLDKKLSKECTVKSN